MAASYKTNDEISWGQEFGCNLQQVIRSKNATQADIAEAVGVSRQIFSRYIHGTAIPSAYKVTQIANALGCSVGELIKDEYN